MTNLDLSSPWVIYSKKVEALFEKDEQVHYEYDNDTPELKLFVDDARKADAISKLLPTEQNFGNVTLKVTVVPTDIKKNERVELFRDAFRDNPAVDHIITTIIPGGGKVTYISFEKEVVQFYDDDLTDENGFCSTLYQELAKEVFGEKGEVYFCTNVEE